MENQFAIVIQSVRHNELTGRKTLYVLGVKLATTRQLALEESERQQKAGFIVDVLPTTQLA